GGTSGLRPGRGLRGSQGHDPRRSGALADAEPGLRGPLAGRGALRVWPDGWERWSAERSAILLTGWRPPNGRRAVLRPYEDHAQERHGARRDRQWQRPRGLPARRPHADEALPPAGPATEGRMAGRANRRGLGGGRGA